MPPIIRSFDYSSCATAGEEVCARIDVCVTGCDHLDQCKAACITGAAKSEAAPARIKGAVGGRKA